MKVTCECVLARGSSRHASVGIWTLGAVLSQRSDSSYLFVQIPESSSGSIYVHLGSIYGAIAALLFCFKLLFGKSREKLNKVNPEDYLADSPFPETAIRLYMDTNYFDRIYSDVFSNMCYFSRLLCSLTNRVRIMRIVSRNPGSTKLSVIMYEATRASTAAFLLIQLMHLAYPGELTGNTK